MKNKKVNLYTGIGLYMVGETGNTSWQNMKTVEAERQLTYLTKHPEIKGSSIYSFKHVAQGKSGSESFSKVKTNLWYKASLLPELKTLSHLPIAATGNISEFNISKTSAGFRLDWSNALNATKYAIYRSSGKLTYDISELIDVVGDIDANGTISYIDTTVNSGNYNYGIKPISKTNQIGNSIEKSTQNVSNGNLLTLEKINSVVISDNTFVNEHVDVKWVPIIPIQGTTPVYEVYSSKDLINWTKVTSTNNPVTIEFNYHTQKLFISSDENVYVKIVAKNNVGISESDVVLVNIKDKYQKANNLYYSGNPYNGEKLTFQWTQVPNKDNLSYVLQYSNNNIDWINVTSEANPLYRDGIFYKQDFTLANVSNKYYFRVIAEDENGKSISDVISLNSKNYIGKIENVKINDQSITGPIRVSYGDTMVISWDNIPDGEYNYLVSGSSDLVNWQGIKPFIAGGYSSSNGNTSNYTAEIGFLYYKFYIRVDVVSTDGVGYSDVYEVIVDVGIHWFDDFIKYMDSENKIYISQLDLFK